MIASVIVYDADSPPYTSVNVVERSTSLSNFIQDSTPEPSIYDSGSIVMHLLHPLALFVSRYRVQAGKYHGEFHSSAEKKAVDDYVETVKHFFCAHETKEAKGMKDRMDTLLWLLAVFVFLSNLAWLANAPMMTRIFYV